MPFVAYYCDFQVCNCEETGIAWRRRFLLLENARGCLFSPAKGHFHWIDVREIGYAVELPCVGQTPARRRRMRN
jgi:hypothetical protein